MMRIGDRVIVDAGGHADERVVGKEAKHQQGSR
jgi:hypothetical protein